MKHGFRSGVAGLAAAGTLFAGCSSGSDVPFSEETTFRPDTTINYDNDTTKIDPLDVLTLEQPGSITESNRPYSVEEILKRFGAYDQETSFEVIGGVVINIYTTAADQAFEDYDAEYFNSILATIIEVEPLLQEGAYDYEIEPVIKHLAYSVRLLQSNKFAKSQIHLLLPPADMSDSCLNLRSFSFGNNGIGCQEAGVYQGNTYADTNGKGLVVSPANIFGVSAPGTIDGEAKLYGLHGDYDLGSVEALRLAWANTLIHSIGLMALAGEQVPASYYYMQGNTPAGFYTEIIARQEGICTDYELEQEFCTYASK